MTSFVDMLNKHVRWKNIKKLSKMFLHKQICIIYRNHTPLTTNVVTCSTTHTVWGILFILKNRVLFHKSWEIVPISSFMRHKPWSVVHILWTHLAGDVLHWKHGERETETGLGCGSVYLTYLCTEQTTRLQLVLWWAILHHAKLSFFLHGIGALNFRTPFK